MDLPVLLFAAGLAVFVSLVIGMIPVLKYSGNKATTGLREGGRGLSQSRERHRARKTLVVVQVALALVLLICSGLMIRTFRALTRVSPGFSDPNTIASFDIFIPTSQVPDTNRIDVLRMQQAIVNQLATVPGVSSVAISTSLPMIPNPSLDPVYASDHTYKEGTMPPLSLETFVSPGFFKTMGIPLIAGRDTTWQEELEKRPVVLVSENLARQYWGSPSAALGKSVRVGSTDPWHEVIGVVGDVYNNGVNQDPPTAVYWGLFQDRFVTQKELVRRYVHFVIRTPRAGSASFFSDSERAVWSVNHDLPLAYNKTMGELYTKSMARTSFTLVMLCVAGAMTLLLSIVGLYGVIAYAISQRTREIGIRSALGAQRDALTGMFVRQGLVLTAVGVACGVAIAFADMRLMSSLLFHVSPVDPWTYCAATLAIVAIAWVATYVPSRRAAVVDPVQALRAGTRRSSDVPSHLRLNVHRSRVAIIRDGDVRLGTRCDAHTEAVLKIATRKVRSTIRRWSRNYPIPQSPGEPRGSEVTPRILFKIKGLLESQDPLSGSLFFFGMSDMQFARPRCVPLRLKPTDW